MNGRGRKGGPVAGGPGGKCKCSNPTCSYTTSHNRARPCYLRKCPRCGSSLTRV